MRFFRLAEYNIQCNNLIYQDYFYKHYFNIKTAL